MKPWMVVLGVLYTIGVLALGAGLNGFWRWLAVTIRDSIITYQKAKIISLRAEIYNLQELEAEKETEDSDKFWR